MKATTINVSGVCLNIIYRLGPCANIMNSCIHSVVHRKVSTVAARVAARRAAPLRHSSAVAGPPLPSAVSLPPSPPPCCSLTCCTPPTINHNVLTRTGQGASMPNATRGALPFDELTGAADFTCRRSPTYRQINAPSVSAHDVAVGMPVHGAWLVGANQSATHMHLPTLCAMGERLACARHTWMGEAGVGLDVLLLADCLPLLNRTAFPALVNEGTHTRLKRVANRRDARDGRIHTAFEFPMAAWLSPQPHHAWSRLEARCYWGPLSFGISPRTNYLKTAVLLLALTERFPSKAWYLKVDADALLRPSNLLQFLSAYPITPTTDFDSGAVHSPSATGLHYFGNSLGAFACSSMANPACVTRGFFRNASAIRDNSAPRLASLGSRVNLRDTAGWQQLEREMGVFEVATRSSGPAVGEAARGMGKSGMPWQHRVKRVTYGMGGSYGLSASAARRLVSSECVRRVGALPCSGPGMGSGCHYAMHGIGLNTHEDAAVGLCMHLLGTTLVQCACFHTYHVPTSAVQMNSKSAASKRARSRSSWLLPPSLRWLGWQLHANATDGALPATWAVTAVRRFFRDDDVSTLPDVSYVCNSPIVMHPIKDHQNDYLPLWAALDARAIGDSGS